jgi:hypothetical protein
MPTENFPRGGNACYVEKGKGKYGKGKGEEKGKDKGKGRGPKCSRKPYDFLSHPIVPCGTLIVIHKARRETWDNFDLIGFYVGPSLTHYRSYRCLVSDTNSYRVSDNIILYPAPLVLPGASRFDQLLALTERLTLAAETHPPDDRTTLSLCAGSFITALYDLSII